MIIYVCLPIENLCLGVPNQIPTARSHQTIKVSVHITVKECDLPFENQASENRYTDKYTLTLALILSYSCECDDAIMFFIYYNIPYCNEISFP